MAAFVHRQVGLERTSSTVTVPNNCVAKLMYYLKCVAQALELNDAQTSHLTQYNNWYNLDNEDRRSLLMLCLLLSPDELIGKVFFPSNELCGDHGNVFYNLNQVNNVLAVSGSVLVGGQQKRVTKIMTFKHVWMQTNYFTPIQVLHGRIQRENAAARDRAVQARAAQSNNSQSCVIL